MIPRYSRPQMAAIWSPDHYFRIQLDIEAYACEAQEELGVIPPGTAKAVRERGAFEVDRILGGGGSCRLGHGDVGRLRRSGPV